MDIGNNTGRLLRLILLILLAGIAALSLRGALPHSEAASPDASAPAQSPPPFQMQTTPLASVEEKSGGGRRKNVYTLILAGLDEVSGNTDTILIARLDAAERRIDLVSIPRDTYINRAWEVRKINCAYSSARNAGENGLEGLRAAMRGLCGFDADCCAVVDLKTVEQAIDLMGGVYFDVPFDMDYEDAAQDLAIHIGAGYQRLSGEQCVQLCRYRKNYINGDLDRISLQQSFLKAAARQFISLGSIPNLARVVQLAASSVDSDLTAANIAYLLRCAIQCSADDIRFYTMPNRPADAGGLSYTFAEKDEWLAMLNDALDPFDAPIGEENLDLVYLEGGRFRSSSGTIRGESYLYRKK
ncbi:MAG: LCP family protein [Oscillospiraceae bacterium]|nr:LCP family protein [Oscillospiraceae bacterium]